MAERKREGKHPRIGDLRQMLRALPIPDAGLVLHLVECPHCAQIARRQLAPKPIRRHKPRAPEAGPGEVEPS